MTPAEERPDTVETPADPGPLTAAPGEPVRLLVPAAPGDFDTSTFTWAVVTEGDGVTIGDVDGRAATFTASSPGTHIVAAREDPPRTGAPVHFVVIVTTTTVNIMGPTVATPNHVVELTAIVAGEPPGATSTWSVTDSGAAVPPLIFEDGLKARVMPGAVGRITVTFTLTALDRTTRARDHVIDVVAGEPEAFDPTEAAWWQDKQKTDTREALASTVAAAARWQGYGTAMLSLFSTVALLSGRKTLAETDNNTLNFIIITAMVIAFLAAFIGLFRLSQVTSQAPRLGPGRTAETYSKEYYSAAALAQARFRGSKSMTVFAAGLIGVASFVLVVVSAQAEADADNKPDSKPLVIVRTPNETLCGVLDTDEDGTITVAGKAIGKSDSILIVESCG